MTDVLNRIVAELHVLPVGEGMLGDTIRGALTIDPSASGAMVEGGLERIAHAVLKAAQPSEAVPTLDATQSFVIAAAPAPPVQEPYAPLVAHSDKRPAPSADADEGLRHALERIARWFGEFPATGRTWSNGSPVSYFACYAANGEREYMRSVARAALAGAPTTS